MEVFPVDPHFSARPFYVGERSQQARLASSIRADQRDRFSGAQLQIGRAEPPVERHSARFHE
jgi:hypothetical protein